MDCLGEFVSILRQGVAIADRYGFELNRVELDFARRIGLDWNYLSTAEVFDEMAACMPSFDGITWQRLQDEHSVTYPVDDSGRSQEIIFREGFPTDSGRG